MKTKEYYNEQAKKVNLLKYGDKLKEAMEAKEAGKEFWYKDAAKEILDDLVSEAGDAFQDEDQPEAWEALHNAVVEIVELTGAEEEQVVNGNLWKFEAYRKSELGSGITDSWDAIREAAQRLIKAVDEHEASTNQLNADYEATNEANDILENRVKEAVELISKLK